MENRRNYYRILHVQPDAPLALVKASYRTLMQQLRYHPDLGGDHWNAALLNEAYAVISDPEKRKRYDASCPDLLRRQQEQAVKDKETKEKEAAMAAARSHCDKVQCRFCHATNLIPKGDQGFCKDCDSPLKRIIFDTANLRFRRIVQRIEASGHLEYYTAWPQAPHQGCFVDISPFGMRILTNEDLCQSEYIKIDTPEIKAVAQVRHKKILEKPEKGYMVALGVKFLTASYNCPNGTFLNLKA